MKAGPRNVPVNNEARITLISVTMIAGRMPYSSNVINVMMFAMPSFIHGTGDGSKLSKPCSPNA